jgi:hypothetical protein
LIAAKWPYHVEILYRWPGPVNPIKQRPGNGLHRSPVWFLRQPGCICFAGNIGPAKPILSVAFAKRYFLPEHAESAVWFPQWAKVLGQLPGPAGRRQNYHQAIVRYLRYCKDTRQRATVASARGFMAELQAQRWLGEAQVPA